MSLSGKFPIKLDRKKHPYPYQFNYVTIELKDRTSIQTQTCFWSPNQSDGEYLTTRDETQDKYSSRTKVKRNVLPYEGATVYVGSQKELFIFQTCQEHGWEYVDGKSIAFHLPPVLHATVYDKNHTMVAENVVVGGWKAREGGKPVIAYFRDNKVHSNEDWVNNATQLDIECLVFANKEEIHWATSNLCWP